MKYLVAILIMLFLFTSISHAQFYEPPQLVYHISLTYDRGAVIFNKAELTEAYIPQRILEPENPYNISLLSFYNNEVLYQDQFKFPLEIIVELGPECFNENSEVDIQKCPDVGLHVLDNATTFIDVPYYPTGSLVKIDDPAGNEVLLIDVSNFASICGNNRCDIDENKYLCPLDCRYQGNQDQTKNFLFITVLILLLIIGYIYYTTAPKRLIGARYLRKA